MTPTTLPHIVLIIMDSVPAKRCSLYGHHRDTTPELRRLAREAVLHRHCFAPANWTVPSHASLFSGLYPSDHGLEENVFELDASLHCLPEILRQLGYHTVGISSNSLVAGSRGFDRFYDLTRLCQSPAFLAAQGELDAFKKRTRSQWHRIAFLLRYSLAHRYFSLPLLQVLNRVYAHRFGEILRDSHFATERTLRLAKRVFRRHARWQPVFLFINFMEAHWKYNPPRRWRRFSRLEGAAFQALQRFQQYDYYAGRVSDQDLDALSLLYEEELLYLDNRLGALYRFLESLGILDDTLFIVTADHGESLGEHGIWGHNFGPYNETVHIPLLVKYPGRHLAGTVAEGLCQLQDLFATILEVVQAPLPLPASSRSLLSQSREYALSEHRNPVGLKAMARRFPNFEPLPFMHPCRAVIDAGLFKLIEWADGRLELFNLTEDYGEAVNLAASPEHQARLAALRQVLQETLGPAENLKGEAVSLL